MSLGTHGISSVAILGNNFFGFHGKYRDNIENSFPCQLLEGHIINYCNHVNDQ
nr:hypothetical protein 1071p1_00091 [Serratia proteamaculans]